MKKMLTLAFVALLLCTACGTKRSQAYYDYSSRIIASELDGSYTLRAYGKGRNAVDAYAEAQKQALYDVIFNGVQSADSKIPPLKPLIMEVNAKEKYAEYFYHFFQDNGSNNLYYSLKERRVMTSKFARTDAQTMAEVTVCVYRSKVAERLRADGIIK